MSVKQYLQNPKRLFSAEGLSKRPFNELMFFLTQFELLKEISTCIYFKILFNTIRISDPKRRNDKEHIPDIKQKRQRRHPYSYRPWSQDERDAVFKHFHRSIVLQKLPGKADYLLCLQEEDALKTRTWLNLKDFVRNQFGKY